jgi:hypothetical protein
MPKRTRRESQDIKQFAASIVRQSTQNPGPVDLTDKAAISQVMRAMGRRGGLKGAAKLNARLTPAQRKKSAQRVAQARWGKAAK